MNPHSALLRRRLAATFGVALVAASIIGAIVLIGASSSSATVDDADGALRGDATASAFDDVPAVANLDPGLLAALRGAAEAAEDDGVSIRVNSGWRSAAYQQVLLQEAIAQHGSAQEAARWVATPEKSEHVSGEAVDLGPLTAQDWLAQRGAEFGLCQIYANERWHFELRPSAASQGCPAMYADPTVDPRMGR